MDRRITETTVDKLSDEHYAQLYGVALAATEQLVADLAAADVLRTADAGEKPGDIDDEPDRRMETLRRVKAGQIAGFLLAEVAAEFTAGEAATAVWLGASLADLGSASGSTRQAARKRWPDLGLIYRTRRWLSGYRDDIFHIADLLLTAIEPGPNTELAQALDEMRTMRDDLRDEFASGSALTTANGRGGGGPPSGGRQGHSGGGPPSGGRWGHSVRWERLGELIDRQVRRVAELGTPDTDEADFALNASTGLLAHYDSVTSQLTR
jgi:uncharacterized membrane protein YgcG